MHVAMFPGQGSQRRGMAGQLFETSTAFRSLEPQINDILGYSVRAVCLNNPGDRLSDTRYTQPCLFVASVLQWQEAVRDGRHADAFAGHSLGEYAALYAAGAFDLLTGLQLVKRRGELMSRSRHGGMAAISGLAADDILEILAQNGFDELEIANFNSSSQTVISGSLDQIQRAAPVFEAARVELYYPLRVSAAFHSKFMAQARTEFAAFVEDFRFAPLRAPVVSNVTGDLYPRAAGSDMIKRLLVDQIVSPVRWRQGIETLIALGATRFEEFGPGEVLTKLVRQVNPAAVAAPRADLQAAAGGG